ncbi:MAG TPA: flavohemoglobin expression-modulating QEGLA motif protein [Lacipirellula sp.]
MTDAEISAAFDRVVVVVHERLSQNLRIRRTLPGDGRLRLDRQLPFLVVYRAPTGPDRGTRDLVTTEAAYLYASGDPEYAKGVSRLCREISEIVQEHFGAVVILEIWSDDALPPAANDSPAPAVRIVAPKCEALDATIDALRNGLREIRLLGRRTDVSVDRSSPAAPPGQQPLAPGCHAGCVAIGIGVRPVYRNADSGDVFPIVLQSLRRQLAVAIRKAVFAFAGRPPSEEKSAKRSPHVAHFEALGPSAMSKAAREVDQQLCEISQAFEFLLYSTPVNSEAAWDEFAASKYRRLPTLYYRPLPYHPTLLKRQLYSIPLEHVEDSTLAQLFERKQDEVGQQLDALKHIGTTGFFYDSLNLHGRPDDELVQLADDILVRTEDAETECEVSHECVGSDHVAAAAREQIDYYHQLLPDFNAKVELTDSIASSLMVAHDHLLISESISIRAHRLEPLLHHEVGTHLLTYFNGRQQPLRLLYSGFAGYEALQEGLAVLAEYFAGGLTIGRTRTLAARVAAVHSMVEGAPFIETFNLLHHQRGIGPKTAFMTTLRVYRGGGLTKDALYLRGLRDLLGYLREGHDLEPLYVGKISLRHVPLVQELRRRGLVQPPAVLPRFWSLPTHDERLAKCRRSTLLDLLEPIV